MYINNSSADFFTSSLFETLKDITGDDSFIPIDADFFVKTGIFEDGDDCEYEICIIRAGSHVWGKLFPNGKYYISDAKDLNVCHAQVSASDLRLVI